MSAADFIAHAQTQLAQIEQAGLAKHEREITSPQSARISVANIGEQLNFCSNNYLGLADDPRLINAAKAAMDTNGLGMASVRFICGSSDLHMRLERDLADYCQMEDAILYSSCFDANTGLFETLLGPEDAIISDALNHASIIDGVRLCKARRFRYANNNMQELETRLQEAQDARLRLIATDGVFSMDGVIANLEAICALAEKYGAAVMVDESHAVGFMGATGAGAVEHCGCVGRVALITGTFGKALGGASGGYVAGPRALIELLRQRSRPYLFSNALAPAICASSLEALRIARGGEALREKLFANAASFRQQMTALGFTLAGAGHPIIPVMIADAAKAAKMAQMLAQRGVYAVAFSYPVVPKGAARIRTQMSVTHNSEDLRKAVRAFQETGEELGII